MRRINMKRILAYLLCVSMMIATVSPINQIKVEAVENTTASTAYPSYSLNGVTTTYYYEDDFSDTEKYENALGNFTEQNHLEIVDGRLENTVATDSKKTQRFASFNGLDFVKNYSVSADVIIGHDDRFTTVGTYANQSGQGYEFGIAGDGTEPYFRIYNRQAGYPVIGTKSTEEFYVSRFFSSYQSGDEITLRMDASTDENEVVNLKCYAIYQGEKKLIFDCSSNSDSCVSDMDITASVANMTLKSGYPCLNSSDDTGYISYVSVASLGEMKDEDCLYADDFSVLRGRKEATVWNQRAEVTMEEVEDNRQAVLDGTKSDMYLEGLEEWTNYIYEADVTMTQAAFNTSTNKVAAICGAANDSSSGYEFGLYYKGSTSECRVRLFDRVLGEPVGTDTSGTSTGYAPFEFTFGKAVHLKMVIAGSTIRCYADDTLLITYEADEILTGGIGIRANGYQAKYDNLSVRVDDGLFIPEVGSTVELYQGFELSPYDYTIDITDENGVTTNVPMTFDMIEEYDNITPGKREVTIDYEGKKTTIPIRIMERPAYIQEFINSVNACADASNISLEDKETVELLEKTYQSLSGYERSQIDESVLTKIHELTEALYRLEHTELQEYDMVYSSDFHDSMTEDWISTAHDARGTWRTLNGVLVNELERYGLGASGSYVTYAPFYGEVNSVEADVMLTDEDGIVSILSNVSDVGYYHARLRKTTSACYVELYKYISGHVKLATKNLSRIALDEWHNLRLTNIDGKVTVYVDDVNVLTYDDSNSTTCMQMGSFGFRSLNGDMRYDSMRVMGIDLSGEVYVPQIETTVYQDNFDSEDDKTGGNPSHWIEEKASDKWKLYEKNGSLVYGTTESALTYTWLHTFESDPTVTLDFMVENAAGRIEFLTRYTQAIYSYAGIGYDFEQSKWYIYTARGEDFEPRILYANEEFELTETTWYTLKIEENGKNIKVYVDDELVLEETNAYMTGYGRIGLLSEQANLYIDELTYLMPHGGTVNDGVLEYIFDDAIYDNISHLEIESLGEGKLIGVNSGKRYLSTDYGATWKKMTSSQYPDVKGKGLGYPSILELSEGVHIMVYADTFEVYKSTDNMLSWTRIGQVIEDIDDNLSAGSAWENIIHVNALTKVTLNDETVRVFLPVGMRRFNEDGTQSNGHYTRIFYSDDGGVTWKESENDTRDITPNYTDNYSDYFSWTESKVIQCADGKLRMYNTRSYDCVVYSESHDKGKTWERMQSVPYLQNGQTSYGIAEDPENPGTYYMVCINAKATMYNSMQPRNRLTLVKSTDGKNWEFVTDVERFSSYGDYKNAELYQIIDPSISIIDGYMYVTMGRSYHGSIGSHGEQSLLLVRLEMDKLAEASEWNDANIADSSRPEILEMDTLPKTIYEVGDTFTIDGGIVKQTAFNGAVTYTELNRFEMVSTTPNMSTKGIHTITMMNRFAQYVSYEIEVVEDATDYYEISEYRKTSSYEYPKKEGYAFGGWYWDAECTTPLAESTTKGRAYAKWVNEKVLSVKAQLSAGGVDKKTGTIMMRLVTTVDCEDYLGTGFYVETKNHWDEFNSQRLLSEIVSRYDGIKVDYTPSGEFHTTSKLFSTIILKNLKATGEHLNKEFTIKPYWITADGTKVYGVTRVLTIQEGLDKMAESVVPYSQE